MGSQGRCLEERRESEAGEDLAASYATLFRELTSVFRARSLGSDEAADLAQETLVRTFVHLKRHGKTQPDLRPLAHTIARRLYVERGRRTRPRLVELPEAEYLVDPAPEPIDHVVSVEERQDVRDALASLAPRHRRVVSMWMGGLRPAEIARELGIKRNAADALLHRARRQLAMKLDPSKVTFGVLGIFVLRLRAASRRLVDGVFSLDPSGSYAQAASGLATIGVAALLIVASGAGSATHDRVASNSLEGSGPTSTIQAESGGRASVGEAPNGEEIAAPVERASRVLLDVREHRARVDTGSDGPLGDFGDLELDFWHERETERGVVGPLLDATTNGLCAGNRSCSINPTE